MPWMEACLDFPNQQYLGRLLFYQEVLTEAVEENKLIFDYLDIASGNFVNFFACVDYQLR